MLVVALTALLLLVWGVPESRGQEPADEAPADDAPAVEAPEDPVHALEQAGETLRDLGVGFWSFFPRILVALACLLLAALVTRLVHRALERALGSWNRAEAASAMTGVVVWLVALGAALSVVAGDARALVGSVGLFGLALSWALQQPIESFTGWLLNSFRGYYRVGDRIAVGEVFGDVYQIDVLTTTVWEAGGPDKPVRGAQPTGALITFPNADVLRANIVNYTRDFPWVWDELTVTVAEESDLAVAVEIAERVGRAVVGEAMQGPASDYARILERAGLGWDVATAPQVFVSPGEFWAEVTVRYLVDARQRRKWSSALYLALIEELSRPELEGRIRPAYVREGRVHG